MQAAPETAKRSVQAADSPRSTPRNAAAVSAPPTHAESDRKQAKSPNGAMT